MKDKLVRFNHKKPYYVFKTIGLSLCIVAGSSVLVALPLSFGINVVNQSKIETKVEVSGQNNHDLKF